MPILATARTTVALLVAVAGVVVIGLIPYTRWSDARERRDFERALAPLVRVPVEDVQPDREQTLTVVLPTDRQWKSLVNRLGKPALLLVLAPGPAATHREIYSATDARLEAQATPHGRPVEISLTADRHPFDYSSTRSQTAYTFSVSADDPVQLRVRMIPTAVPKGALLLVVPFWNPLEMWHWGDGMSIGEGIFSIAVPVLIAIGVGLIFIGAMVGLLPLQPTR